MLKLSSETRGLAWLGEGTEAFLTTLHCELPVTAVMALLRAESTGRLALVRVAKRGWDLPGGHREEGESCLESLQRELLEEVGLTVPPEACQERYRLVLRGNRPPYPSESCILFYSVRVPEESTLYTSLECTEAAWVGFETARRLCADKWWPEYLL